MQINNTLDRRAIEITVGLGTFSFKDQPIKVRLEVYAIRAVLLRIRGTRMHVALSNESRALCRYVNRCPTAVRVSRGTRRRVRATFRSPALYIYLVLHSQDLMRGWREIAKLRSNGLISTSGAITIEYISDETDGV